MSPKDERSGSARSQVPPEGQAAGVGPGSKADADVSSQTGLDFEASMDRLEAVVRELEGGKVSLERAMALFEEGRKLGQACRAALDSAQVRVDKLLERADGSAESQPFEPSR